MTQHDYNIANQGFSSFRSDLNNALSAVQTTNSGTSRPTGAVAGQLWLDTTSPTTPTLKYYDGADDISLATIDHTANTVNWLDSTVSITGLSTTATGTVLTLSDSATTSTVNLIIDNDKEIRFREATANGTNYVSLSAPASLSADLTFTLPSADGTNGQALITNGSGVLSFTTISAGTSWQSVQTTGFTAVAGRGYPCNTTSSAFTVTLPASPSVGDYVQIVDYAGTFATNTITLGANSNKIEGGTANKILTTNREAVTLTYVDSTQGWVSSSGANEGTQSIDPNTVSIDFLVIAGGGGGGGPGGTHSGGGGAGGYRTSTQTVNIGNVITVTVGDGGACGVSGSNSSISGSSLTTITSAGGGYGGIDNNAGISGGSGGGGGGATPNGGSGNTPSTSPSQGNNGGSSTYSGPNYGSGGGGGAGAVGSNGTSSNGGAGGAGTASSITGSSVTRAGGGGGNTYNGGSGGSGGTGGGGAGGSGTPGTGGNPGIAATANTGGGGGGGAGSTGGTGGKGVVILSVPTTKYSATSTGSPTVTTSGSNTILQFNGTGSYTA
jgi:hypothetical protein